MQKYYCWQWKHWSAKPSAQQCMWLLTRNWSLSCDSLMPLVAMHILFCPCPCKVRSRVSDALSQALCNLSLAFPADFTLSYSTAPIHFLANCTLLFERQDHSVRKIDWARDYPSYRYSSFTLWAYLCWRHTCTYCQWPIIEFAKNVSPKNKMATTHVVQIHMHVRFPRSKKMLIM